MDNTTKKKDWNRLWSKLVNSKERNEKNIIQF